MKLKIILILLIINLIHCGATVGIYQTWSYEKRLENRKSSMILGIEPDHPPIYAGLDFDWSMVNSLKSNNVFFYLVALDLPFTLAVDTILIPVTIPLSIYHCKLDREKRYPVQYGCKSDELW